MEKDFTCGGCLRGLCARGCGRQNKQLNTYDYLADVPGNVEITDLVEVQFKNTRKDYFVNSNHLPLNKGDIVAVEASPGHDIGTVTLTGSLVKLQMQKARLKGDAGTRRIYRIARDTDMEKFEAAKTLEHETMIKSRQIAKDLGLQMKIGDVEYQGDGNKAIFYYIADQRVDFRQLIKVLAEAFHIRIEMRQIGARQEAGHIGGIGPCGRELCCATWMKNFNTVSTSAARTQDVSLNPQKLAGQCAKLKCCLNYEVSTYLEAAARIPGKEITLETKDGTYYLIKADALEGLVCYSTDKRMLANAVTISVERAHKIIEMNKSGEKPDALDEKSNVPLKKVLVDLAEQDSLTRFDKAKKFKGRNRNRNNQNGDGQRGDYRGQRAEGGRQDGGARQPRREGNQQNPNGEQRHQNGDQRRQEGGQRHWGGNQQHQNRGNRSPRERGNRYQGQNQDRAPRENNSQPKQEAPKGE